MTKSKTRLHGTAMTRTTASLAAGFLAIVASALYGQRPAADAVNVVLIPRLVAPASLTADLNAAPWNRAARLAGLVASGGRTLSKEPTSVCLFYDASSLYIGFHCEGRGASQLKAEIKDRDGRVWADDSVEFLLDPKGSPEDCFQIVVNAAGVIYDSAAGKKSWNANMATAVNADERGWTVVTRLPFADLDARTPKPGETWTGNFCHNSSLPERSAWAPVLESFLETGRFGRIVFGGPDLRPVRFVCVRPIVIGANEIRLDPFAGLGVDIQEVDSRDRARPARKETLRDDGACAFTLKSDETRAVRLAFRDPKGALLVRCTYPMTSPRVADRIRMLQRRFDDLTASLPRFRGPARARVETLVTELRPRITEATAIVGDAQRNTPDHWMRLETIAGELELKLDVPWALSQTLAFAPESPFAVGFVGPARKVMIRDFPFDGTVADRVDVSLARNEHEGVQVVVMPFDRDLRGASVSVSPLRGADDGREFAGGKTAVSLVGHVNTKGPTPYEVTYFGWWPDPLLDFQQKADIRAGEHVAFWIDVATAATTPPGDYEATITVAADESAPVKLRLHVRVWDFELPMGSTLPTAFTYDEHQVRRIYGERWTRELAYKYYDAILSHRLNIDHLYRGHTPDLDVIQYGVARGMNAFNLLNLGYGDAGGERRAALDACVPKIRALGLLGKAYVYGFDEVKEERFAAMRTTFGQIHEWYPGLRTMTTAVDRTFGRGTSLRDLVDIWVPLTPSYDRDEAVRLRAEGKAMWWYVCVVPRPPYANWFIESQAIEARLLTGAMSYKYKADGFLYYLITLWTGNRKPIASGPYTGWNPGSFFDEKKGKTANGDGSLLCPGPDGPLSTIRLENIRDGLEDFEYLCLLAARVAAARKMPPTPRRDAYIQRAERLLAVPDPVVTDLINYTRDANELSQFRSAVAEAILQGASIAGPAKAR